MHRRRAAYRRTAATINHHRPSNPRHLLYRLYRAHSSPHTLSTTWSPSNDLNLTYTLTTTIMVRHNARRLIHQTAHTANHTRSSHSPSASSLTPATPSKPPSHPQLPRPPASTTPFAPTNPSTHPTTPRPPSQQSPPHTLWNLAFPTGAPLKMHSR